MSRTPIRVVLGEDDLIVREGVQRLLGGMDKVRVVAAVGNHGDLEEAVERLGPDVVVTDMRLPPTFTDEGLRLAAALRRTHPDVGVVVLSQDVVPEYVRALLTGGAGRRAYLLRQRVTDQAQLESVVRAVAAGESYVDVGVVERVMDEIATAHPNGTDALTSRQREVLTLLAEAKSNDAIARELGVSTRAVERHVNAIFRILHIPESAAVSRRVKAALVYLESRPRS